MRSGSSRRGGAPVALLLSPWALAAIAVMLANDHWLRHAHPGWVSGKLSDVAGLVFFPALLHDVSLWLAPPPSGAVERRRLVVASLLTALVFAAVKTLHGPADLYRWGLGALQWPFFAVRAAWHGAAAPGVVPVRLLEDATDLLAVPFAAVGLLLRRGEPLQLASAAMACAAPNPSRPSTAAPTRPHRTA